ncbi:MAG: DOMON domain-containing protein [Candidatus Hodarchaeota archaeon]
MKPILKTLVITFLVIFSVLTFLKIITSQNETLVTKAIVEEIPVHDGIINLDEYSDSKSFYDGNFILYWQIEGDIIYLGFIGTTNGWVTIGIEPTVSMLDADMIFGWVNMNSTVEILDCFSTGKYGPHPPDTELGGTNDILAYNGSEDSGKITIEFSRKLAPGDEYDKEIPATGEVNIIWALGPSDNYLDKHTRKGAGTMSMSMDSTSDSTDSTSDGTEQSTSSFHFLIVILAIIGLTVKHQKSGRKL